MFCTGLWSYYCVVFVVCFVCWIHCAPFKDMDVNEIVSIEGLIKERKTVDMKPINPIEDDLMQAEEDNPYIYVIMRGMDQLDGEVYDDDDDDDVTTEVSDMLLPSNVTNHHEVAHDPNLLSMMRINLDHQAGHGKPMVFNDGQISSNMNANEVVNDEATRVESTLPSISITSSTPQFESNHSSTSIRVRPESLGLVNEASPEGQDTTSPSTITHPIAPKSKADPIPCNKKAENKMIEEEVYKIVKKTVASPPSLATVNETAIVTHEEKEETNESRHGHKEGNQESPTIWVLTNQFTVKALDVQSSESSSNEDKSQKHQQTTTELPPIQVITTGSAQVSSFAMISSSVRINTTTSRVDVNQTDIDLMVDDSPDRLIDNESKLTGQESLLQLNSTMNSTSGPNMTTSSPLPTPDKFKFLVELNSKGGAGGMTGIILASPTFILIISILTFISNTFRLNL